ncbi:hypothetical protein P3S68_024301 [Capsicum galapagoense]
MESEGTKSVTIHVTRFKKFHGVAQNPIETAINILKDYDEQRGLAADMTLGSSTILEKIGESGILTLLKFKKKESSLGNSLDNGHVIWASSTQINLLLLICVD